VDAVAVVSCVVACVVVGLDVEHVWERVGSQSYSPSTTRVAHQDLRCEDGRWSVPECWWAPYGLLPLQGSRTSGRCNYVEGGRRAVAVLGVLGRCRVRAVAGGEWLEGRGDQAQPHPHHLHQGEGALPPAQGDQSGLCGLLWGLGGAQDLARGPQQAPEDGPHVCVCGCGWVGPGTAPHPHLALHHSRYAGRSSQAPSQEACPEACLERQASS